MANCGRFHEGDGQKFCGETSYVSTGDLESV